jgi:hypothetical protein
VTSAELSSALGPVGFTLLLATLLSRISPNRGGAGLLEEEHEWEVAGGRRRRAREKRTKLAVLVVAPCHEAVVMPHTRCRHPMFSFLAHACCCITWSADSFSRESGRDRRCWSWCRLSAQKCRWGVRLASSSALPPPGLDLSVRHDFRPGRSPRCRDAGIARNPHF